MLKFIKRLLVVGVALLLSSQVMAKDFVEGTHYKVVSQETTANKEVREFFSFWCGHCFALQESYHYIADNIKDKAKFVPNPVGILGGPMGVESQYAYAVSKMLGMEDLFTKTLFTKMHIDGDIPRSHKDFVKLMEELGIPAQKFESEYKSFPVAGTVATYSGLVDKYGLDAVPELVVNGKYLVIQESVDTAGDLLEVIQYLLDKDDVK